VIPYEDAHQSECVTASDRRLEYISGFSGFSGQAIVSKNSAHLVTDSRFWPQAQEQLDDNWTLVRAGGAKGPKDWIEWLDKVRGSRIGIDARMISHEKATLLNSRLGTRGSMLFSPPQNLVDLVWIDKPAESREPILKKLRVYTGGEARSKLQWLREWISAQPPSAHVQVAALITSLSSIAYLLNLSGSDFPFNMLFKAYLFVSQQSAVLFVDVSDDTGTALYLYLQLLGVERRDYNDVWQFLRQTEWGVGKVLITPQTPYIISLLVTHFRYTVAPSFIEERMAFKNITETEGLRQAYLRDGVCFVRFLAWLETKLDAGYDITEFEAGFRLAEFQRSDMYFMKPAHAGVSATGPNGALTHYSPDRGRARMIERETPYLIHSGAHYRDGTCDTTRTLHFGRPTPEQIEAFTRVLRGHIAVDKAVVIEGMSCAHIDVLARKAFFRDGKNYRDDTRHEFRTSLFEGRPGLSNSILPGYYIANESGFYSEGQWGVCLKSALMVRSARVRRAQYGITRLSFRRLACVPIQTRMVQENMLTKEEQRWLKEHNQGCFNTLAHLLKEDKRALKWLKRQADGIGIATGRGGISIEW
ncbi:peptidase M24, structural domain-containing protein, partial [Mycena leptocephala]